MGKPSVNGVCSIAMFDYQKISQTCGDGANMGSMGGRKAKIESL